MLASKYVNTFVHHVICSSQYDMCFLVLSTTNPYTHTHTLHVRFTLGAVEQPLLMHNVNCSLKRRHFKVHTAGCHPSPSPLHTCALPARLPPLHGSKGVRGGSDGTARTPPATPHPTLAPLHFLQKGEIIGNEDAAKD